MIIVPDITSAEYAETVARIRAELRHSGRAAVKVNRMVYDVVAIDMSSTPVRRIYIALNGRRAFMRRTVAELVSVILSGSGSEFEFRDDTDPADALEGITGSFFSPPDEKSGNRQRISNGGGVAALCRRSPLASASDSASTPGP